MEYYRDNWKLAITPERRLKVIIVGAGISGLATGIGLRQSGHDIIILEQVPEITEVGAGIQMAPNSTRILARWDVLGQLSEHVNFMEATSVRSWKYDTELGRVLLMPTVARHYGAPLGVIHRGDLQRILLATAVKGGCDIRTDHKVAKIDENFEPRVQLTNGKWIEGDIIVAADGIKSGIRKQIAAAYEHSDRVIPTGDAAYRLLIPKEKMLDDEKALHLLSTNMGMRWLGPGGHIMAYPVKKNTVYNMVLIHPEKPKIDHEEGESWTRKGSKVEMLDFYRHWCPTVQKLLSHVKEDEIMEWSLNGHRPLPAWHKNKVVLIGDACHPMLPYVAQGAAQAIEDAAVLQCVLAKSSTHVTHALAVYEQVRKARGEAVQYSAAHTREDIHLPDGPEQRERDQKIRTASNGQGSNPDLLVDSSFQQFLWGTDIMQETIVKWPEWEARLRALDVKG